MVYLIHDHSVAADVVPVVASYFLDDNSVVRTVVAVANYMLVSHYKSLALVRVVDSYIHRLQHFIVPSVAAIPVALPSVSVPSCLKNYRTR